MINIRYLFICDLIIKGSVQLHTRNLPELGKFAITQATKLKVLIDSIPEVEAYPKSDYKEVFGLMKYDSSSLDVVLFTKRNGWGNSSIVTKWQC